MLTVLKLWYRSSSALVSSHIPTKKQYENWSLPSKLTALAFFLAVILAPFTIVPFFLGDDSTERIIKETKKIKGHLEKIDTFGFTEEQYGKFLEEQRKAIREEMRAANGNEKKLKLLEQKYSVVQNKLVDLQKSYEERERLLKRTSEDLERIKGDLPDSQIAEAEEKLERGDTEAAEHAFVEVANKGAGAVALAFYRSGTLAEDRLDYAKAMLRYKKAAVLEEENPEYLLAAGKMARTLAEYQMAQDWLEQLLKIRKAEKKEDTELASVLYNLAWVYKDQGHYDEAEPLYKRSLAIKEKSLGKDHPEVATTLNNLAALYESQGRYDEAEPLYKRSLEIKEKSFGKDHPSVATTLNNLAELYRQQGRYDEAEPLYKRCSDILNAAFPNGHPHIEIVKGNIAELKKSMN